MPLEVGAYFQIPESELDEVATRGSGPGGQKRNKTSSRVQLRWNIASSEALSPSQRARLLDRLAHRLTEDGSIVLSCGETRSQAQNRSRVRERLAEVLVAALTPRKRRQKTRPSRRAKQRRLEAKRNRGETKRRRQKPVDE